ncbi:hypothetical protein N752_20400 [Desulforamulus aquiferis]|nr:hypothetical protein N752_20400 [Desulforamulus aquiferis]
MSDTKTAASNFIQNIIADDFDTNKHGGRSIPGFRPNPTDTCILVMPSQYALTLALPGKRGTMQPKV